MPVAPARPSASDGPLVPFHYVDGPSQRFYALAIYIALFGCRLYDWYGLIEEDGDSISEFWNFLKWGAIDGVFLYGLPGLRIPWLEWSWTTTTAIFLAHAIMDGCLMFRVSVPLLSWLLAVVKIFYDREVAISEHRVDPAAVMYNASLILGKQTIHILPEGSAMLNPGGGCFCLDASMRSINLPIRINQTNPILIELLRIDLDTNQNETITLSAKQVKDLKRKADKTLPKSDITSPRFLNFEVKRTGVYRLQKVVDESKLEVQRRLSDTLVVACPKASITRSHMDKCKGELSNLSLQVEGMPPLKIKYSRTVNREDKGVSFQSIQPENLLSPFTGGQRTSGALIGLADTDVSWARTQSISVPLNESLSTSGIWFYSLDEVHDACGNIANYTIHNDDGERVRPKGANIEQTFVVHERPKASMSGCDPQHPLKVAKGRAALLPIQLGSTGRSAADIGHTLTYIFTPQERLQANGEHAVDAKVEEISLKMPAQGSAVKEHGLYTLKSVSNQFCTGEVMEPASCLVLNPPEPDMAIKAEEIHDKCAGKSIGLTVDLDLLGTPPFDIHYEVTRKGDKHVQRKTVHVSRLRHQLHFTPQEAGHYTYRFRTIDDSVYKEFHLPNVFVLEQDVKPPASARLVTSSLRKKYCIEEPISFDVRLQGEAPWTLEYELVHGGKRSKRKIKDIETELHTITTDSLANGGEYALALASVQDKTGCKIFLEEEVKIDVRRQRPKASFGQLEGKRNTLTLEGIPVKLPLRLTGEAPWKVKYRNLNDTPQPLVYDRRLHSSNDFLEVRNQGIFEIVDIQDNICPGTVDPSASAFEVQWIPRPEIQVSESALVELAGNKYVKKQVCEGDEDTLEISLSGTPPYNIKYEQRLSPEHGAGSLAPRELTVGLGVASIRMETSRAGQYEYIFSELGDHMYDHDWERHSPLVVQQRVNPRPSARFKDLGRTYNYCKEEESDDEVVPIILEGVPPFYLEVGIKPHTNGKPETVTVPNINTKTYDFRIPHRVLTLGHHTLSVRKVRDARGCQRKTEFDAPQVPVHVSDVPAISPFEGKTDYCVGDRIAYTLSGTPPFNVFYTFEGVESKATTSTTTFRRIAQKPGNFTITALTDNAAHCRARTQITKIIHQMPSVRIGKGRETVVDIHEGGEAEIIFEFWGTPPFEFTYTRSTAPRKGQKRQVLETKHDTSHDHVKIIKASDEGTYEVVAIKDKHCAFSILRADGGAQKQKQKQIKYR
ncbi:MAG: hypothetical protein M1839_000274 [Geoglossum umbratile]|nr:MAG: hypothetical protein M1839_000274 [Geoglossum umbratile]